MLVDDCNQKGIRQCSLMIWDSLLGLIGFLKDPLIPFTQRLKIGTWWQTIGGSYYKASAYSSRDLGSIPGSGRSPGVGNGNPLHYSSWRIPRRGAWGRGVTVQGIKKIWTWLYMKHKSILSLNKQIIWYYFYIKIWLIRTLKGKKPLGEWSARLIKAQQVSFNFLGKNPVKLKM